MGATGQGNGWCCARGKIPLVEDPACDTTPALSVSLFGSRETLSAALPHLGPNAHCNIVLASWGTDGLCEEGWAGKVTDAGVLGRELVEVASGLGWSWDWIAGWMAGGGPTQGMKANLCIKGKLNCLQWVIMLRDRSCIT